MNISNKLKIYARNLRYSQTSAEDLLWYKLRNRQLLGVKFRRQQPIDSYIVDFVSIEKKLIIELDGSHHNTPSRKIYDSIRTIFLQKKQFKVLRFWDNEVLTNIDGVLEMIRRNIT
jgi:very-short-patch-repair endonuclease